MKKLKVLMMTLMMCLASVSVLGQETKKPINIDGFGYLKLGMHRDSVIKGDVIPINHDNYLNYVWRKDTISNRWSIAVVDTNDVLDIFGSLDNRVETYFIGYIQVSKYVKLTNVELRFFNDTLFFIKTGKCLDKILTLKYGEPMTNYEEEKHTFVNDYGKEVIKEDLKVWYKWNTIENIGLICLNWFYYDSKGKLNHTESTILCNNDIRNIVSKRVTEIKNIKKDTKNKIEQSKVSDF